MYFDSDSFLYVIKTKSRLLQEHCKSREMHRDLWGLIER